MKHTDNGVPDALSDLAESLPELFPVPGEETDKGIEDPHQDGEHSVEDSGDRLKCALKDRSEQFTETVPDR